MVYGTDAYVRELMARRRTTGVKCSRGTGMLINTFENSERTYSQDSWILIRPLHFLAAASAPDVAANTTAIPCTIGVHNLPVFSGCHSQDLSSGASYPSMSCKAKLAGKVVRKSYLCPHAARGYHVKLQCQGYTERRTTDNLYII